MVKIIGKRERASSPFLFNKWPKAPLSCLIPPIPPVHVLCLQGLPSEGSSAGPGAAQHAGTTEPPLPSKARVLAELPSAGASGTIPAPQPHYVNTCSQRH